VVEVVVLVVVVVEELGARELVGLVVDAELDDDEEGPTVVADDVAGKH